MAAYKFEMHLHTIGRSPCAKAEPAEIARRYAEKGYDGIVVTNHFMQWLFEDYYPAASERDRVEYYLDGYRELKRRAEEYGIAVLLGAEVNLERYNLASHTHPTYEFLSYGLTEEFLLEHPRLYELSQEELFALYEENNFLMVQAHPFRTRSLCADYRYMHGVEVYNGNPRHNSFDPIAAKFCEEHALMPVSGSDFHEEGDEGRGGMILCASKKITTGARLVTALRDGFDCAGSRLITDEDDERGYRGGR